MRQLRGLLGRVYLLQAEVVAELLEVDVVGLDAPGAQVLDHARVGQRVQVGADDHGYVAVDVLTLGLELACRLLDDHLDLVGEHEGLDELDVAVLRVPVNVSGAHEEHLSLAVLVTTVHHGLLLLHFKQSSQTLKKIELE